MINKLFKECLEIIDNRGQDYGEARESFSRIANLWSAYLDKELTGKDVAMLMVLFKIAREQGKHKHDNIVDAINYLALTEVL